MSGLLALSNVSVALGKTLAAHGVSLDVARGDIVALLGPNGAGKTTLVRAALGFVVPSAGSVRLVGDDPRWLSPRERALRAAYLPQRPLAVWPVSVENLVALGRFAYGASPDRLSARDQACVDAALEACALSHLRARRMDENAPSQASTSVSASISTCTRVPVTVLCVCAGNNNRAHT